MSKDTEDSSFMKWFAIMMIGVAVAFMGAAAFTEWSYSKEKVACYNALAAGADVVCRK